MGSVKYSRYNIRLTMTWLGRMKNTQKNIAFEKAKASANIKISIDTRIRIIKTRGKNSKFKALRINTRKYNWRLKEFIWKPKKLMFFITI